MMRQTVLRIICNFYQQVERQDLGEYGKARPQPSTFLLQRYLLCLLHSQHPRAQQIKHSVNVTSKKLHLWLTFHCVPKIYLSALTEKSAKPPGIRL